MDVNVAQNKYSKCQIPLFSNGLQISTFFKEKVKQKKI